MNLILQEKSLFFIYMRIMRIYLFLSLLGLLFLLGSCATKKKYKRLKVEHQEMKYTLDSTRYQLAEALREWQKIRDRSDMTTGELQDLTKDLEAKNKQLKTEINASQQQNKQLKDSIKQTQEAFGMLQKEWGAIAERQAILEARIEKIQLEVIDSLSDWDSLGLDVLRFNEFLHIEVSDQILFNKGYYVNNDGRAFLAKLAPILEKYQANYQLVVRAVVLPQKDGMLPIESSLKRALNVAKMLREVGFKGKELRVLGMGEWKKPKAGTLPPVGIDLIPLENAAFRNF
jgi:chemotaxis protein MotB